MSENIDQVVTKYEGPKALIVQDESDFSNLLDTGKFNHLWRVAQVFAMSNMVPDHFRGKSGEANCFIALHMAFRLGVDPLMLMQNSYIVHGRPGIEAKLKIALCNARSPFTGPIQWRFEGEGKGRKCTAYATHSKTGELCEVEIAWELVEKEGWASKNGSKWLTMPDQMFRYRSASWLINAYCPEVVLGLSSVDELEDFDAGRTIEMTAIAEDAQSDDWKLDLPRMTQGMTATEALRLETFIIQTARANKTSPADVMKQAGIQGPAFWKSFKSWQSKKSPSAPATADIPIKPEPTAEGPGPDADTSPAEGPAPPPDGGLFEGDAWTFSEKFERSLVAASENALKSAYALARDEGIKDQKGADKFEANARKQWEGFVQRLREM